MPHSSATRIKQATKLFAAFPLVLLAACGGDSTYPAPGSTDLADSETTTTVTTVRSSETDQKLKVAIDSVTDYDELKLPVDGDYDALPLNASNPISDLQVELGRQIFHDTLFAVDSREASRAGSYSCASCHHVQAGFKSGVAQGVGDGGIGFGLLGEARLADQEVLTRAATDSQLFPDVQDIASPTILNSAYQEVMLWNGQFGNDQTGMLINASIDPERLATEDTPKAFNNRELPGLETQAMAGMGVHRLRIDPQALASHPEYLELFSKTYPNEFADPEAVLEADPDTLLLLSAKAVANYERTVLANEAPFQKWLRGDLAAMSERQKEGAALFFGKAGCADCHRGPALSSEVGAPADEIFFAVGFADLVQDDIFVVGEIKEATKKGRGGFTGVAEDNYKFKVPPLYNLRDSGFLGHGSSFSSVAEVVRYKNRGIAQNQLSVAQLDERFRPLGLDTREEELLTEFIAEALYDPELIRHVPTQVISGFCFPVNDSASRLDLGCD